MKSENKTQPTNKSVTDFIDAIPEEGRKQDCRVLREMMESITGEKGVMWGDAIVGFGLYHYVYATGREGDMPKVGFSPRKQALTLYLSYGFENQVDLMKKLGKYKTGKICLYVNRLSDLDSDVLRELILRSYQYFK
jgi:hypothetical protein